MCVCARYRDDRFSAIFDSHQYAIDPNDPKYKPTPAMRTVMDERQERRKKKRQRGEKEIDSAAAAAKAAGGKGGGKKQKLSKSEEVAQLVASVKRKQGK